MDVDENDDKLGLGKDCFGLIPLDRATLRVFGHTNCSNSPLGWLIPGLQVLEQLVRWLKQLTPSKTIDLSDLKKSGLTWMHPDCSISYLISFSFACPYWHISSIILSHVFFYVISVVKLAVFHNVLSVRHFISISVCCLLVFLTTTLTRSFTQIWATVACTTIPPPPTHTHTLVLHSLIRHKNAVLTTILTASFWCQRFQHCGFVMSWRLLWLKVILTCES